MPSRFMILSLTRTTRAGTSPYRRFRYVRHHHGGTARNADWLPKLELPRPKRGFRGYNDFAAGAASWFVAGYFLADWRPGPRSPTPPPPSPPLSACPPP